MPSKVTAFGVKIASPGEAAMEVIIAREVIGQWNSQHGFAEHRALLPFDAHEKDAEGARPCDMLIAFFCGSSGVPIDRTGDTEAEIVRQIRQNKPAHVYVSGARVDLIGRDADRAQALEGIRKKYAPATVDLYGDEKEFRAKFSRNLEVTIETHSHFRRDAGPTAAPAAAREPASAKEPFADRSLSECAKTILVEACDDFEGYIGHIKVGAMLRIQANGKQLVDGTDAATITRWESAFSELLDGGYIRDAGCNGQLFQISPKGFDFLKTLGKTPVGYIAELGGM